MLHIRPMVSRLRSGVNPIVVKELWSRMRGVRAFAILTAVLLLLAGVSYLFYRLVLATTIYSSAPVYGEGESEKGIVIGQDGKHLKQIGRPARREIEDLVGTRVFLELWVKTRPKWRSKDDDLIQLGYR